MTNLVEQLQRQGASEEIVEDSGICDGCYGIADASDGEVCDHRCDLCKRPLSCAGVWLDANRGHLTPAEVEAVAKVLMPEREKVYRVRYWSVVLEQTLTSGLMTKARAEVLATSVYGKVVREGE